MKYIVTILLSLIHLVLNAQESSFTQYFQSPLLFNPASAGSSNSTWRFNNIFRQQFFGPNASFNTIATSFDSSPVSIRGFGVGALFLSDKTLGGNIKSTTASANLSYSVYFDEGRYNKLSIGFAGIYGTKRIDFSKLTFANQYVSSGGFDQNLSSGEANLNASSTYLTSGAGLIYNNTKKNFAWEIGAAVYNLNRPKLSILNDSFNYVPNRYIVHSKCLLLTDGNGVIDLNAMYQSLQNVNYYTIGAIYTNNYLFLEGNKSISGGVLYNSNKIVTPYLGIKFTTLQLSFTYDIFMSSTNINLANSKTFEFSINFLPNN